MTCVVGVVSKGAVTLGADSSAEDRGTVLSAANAKIFRVADLGVGFCGSFRAGDAMRYCLDSAALRERRSDALAPYVVRVLVPAMRAVLRGLDVPDDGATSYLVGGRGSLVQIGPDWSVIETSTDYQAIGSGEEIALGSLASTSRLGAMTRVRLALESAARHCTTVRAPFAMLVVK